MRAQITMTAAPSKTSVLPDCRRHGDLTLLERVGPGFTDHYVAFGFALLANALAPDEVAAVNADALKLCRGDFGTIHYGLSGVEGRTRS